MSSHVIPSLAVPLRARRSGPLKGVGVVPGDKSISQRALILGALAAGQTTVSGLLESQDVLDTARCLAGFGADLQRQGAGAWTVTGTGVGKWRTPDAPLDFGNSGTGSRLVMGAMATTPITAVFTGDASLMSRPMGRVVQPLVQFGARYEGQGEKVLMPLTVHGAANAQAITTEIKVASAQVKSALLLAALNAEGETILTQPVRTRDHTEKMLEGFGAEISVRPHIIDSQGAGFADQEFGDVITLKGKPNLQGCSVEVPRDPSSAAFAIVAALIVPGSEITLPGIMLNERRTGLIQTLLQMGGQIEVKNERNSSGERIGDLTVRHSALKGVVVPRGRAASMIDEYPILAVLAAFAEGETKMLGLEELRVKESDRLAAIAAGLAANGVACSITGDDLTVRGMASVPGGGTVTTHMDHRIAMSFLTMGLASQNPVTVDDVAMIATSFPSYRDLMRGLGAAMEAP